MGWVLFWAAVVVVLALLWFSPYLWRRRPGHTGTTGPTEPRPERVLREAERGLGQSGRGVGMPGSGFGGGE